MNRIVRRFICSVENGMQPVEVDVAEIPQIKRGLVWCTTCGRNQSVKGMNCLRDGWPECCGYTMTIDSPEERATLKEEPR